MSDMTPKRSAEARQHMIDSQFRPNEVNDARLIAAFQAVPREQFVPKALRGVAYVDEDLAIGGGRFLMEPMVYARLLDAAKVTAEDLVLDVACATGYSAAVLSHLADRVVAIEEDADLAKKAESKLADLDIHSVPVLVTAHKDGAAKQGPYSLIVINGAVDDVPDALVKQLADGGRLVCVRMDGGVGRGHLVTKNGGIASGRDLFDAHVPPLAGFERDKGFVF